MSFLGKTVLRSGINARVNLQAQLARRSYAANHGKELQLSYLTEDKQGIAVIGLNKGVSKNAFSKSLVQQLTETVDLLKHDRNVRVVILRSLVPGVFCAGGKLSPSKKTVY